MDPFWRGPVLATGLLLLAACGDGDSEVQTSTATGVFKDSSVAGLSYVSGQEEGVTGADGSFTYEVGREVTFFLGGLTLGTALGQAVVTPLDLVRNGASDDIAVLNRVRFLLMLDDDDEPDNGIQISSAVQDRARVATSIWRNVDFSVSEPTLAAELNLVIFDLNNLEGVQQLPTAAQARAHLEDTLRCVRSGAFRGALAGGDSGEVGLMIDAGSGELRGYARRAGNPALITLAGSSAVSLDRDAFFISVDTTAGATFTGRLIGIDDITGSWEVGAQQPAGTFQGQRIGGEGDARYRYTASYSGGGDAGVYAFDIDAAGRVTGAAYSVMNDESTTVSGSLSGGVSLSARTSDQTEITATVDLDAGTLSGGDSLGDTLNGSGCRLN
jgi:hypothetical protein